MGIDYCRGLTNIDFDTGIRYGVISQNEVLQAWCDSSEPYYGEPTECECPHCNHNNFFGDTEWGDTIECDECGESFEVELPYFAEPISHTYIGEGYEASAGEDGDIFITLSPYYTYAEFCSPCAPGAGYIMNEGNVKAYCFGHDWFEGEKAPYNVYKVSDNSLVIVEALDK